MFNSIFAVHMWPKSYKDYPIDDPLIQYPVEPGKGIIGCEMHDFNGWGNSYHIPRSMRQNRTPPHYQLTRQEEKEFES